MRVVKHRNRHAIGVHVTARQSHGLIRQSLCDQPLLPAHQIIDGSVRCSALVDTLPVGVMSITSDWLTSLGNFHEPTIGAVGKLAITDSAWQSAGLRSIVTLRKSWSLPPVRRPSRIADGIVGVILQCGVAVGSRPCDHQSTATVVAERGVTAGPGICSKRQPPLLVEAVAPACDQWRGRIGMRRRNPCKQSIHHDACVSLVAVARCSNTASWPARIEVPPRLDAVAKPIAAPTDTDVAVGASVVVRSSFPDEAASVAPFAGNGSISVCACPSAPARNRSF